MVEDVELVVAEPGVVELPLEGRVDVVGFEFDTVVVEAKRVLGSQLWVRAVDQRRQDEQSVTDHQQQDRGKRDHYPREIPVYLRQKIQHRNARHDHYDAQPYVTVNMNIRPVMPPHRADVFVASVGEDDCDGFVVQNGQVASGRVESKGRNCR